MNSPDTLPLAPAAAPADELPLEFTGSGGAYFKIWIVNLLLSIVTLGIYSAWAKVRRERYFLNNTLLDGSPFEYHANPVSILKGRLLVVGVLIAANIAAEFNPLLNLAVTVVFFALLPWMISRAMRFRACVSLSTAARGMPPRRGCCGRSPACSPSACCFRSRSPRSAVILSIICASAWRHFRSIC